jgi:phosphoribosylanthranilate isomerase
MTKVKICGITRAQDARLAEKLGAWAIGFNFYEKSPRSISPADAWKIRKQLEIQPVGVFVNWKPEAVLWLARSVDLSAVQLHGDESPSQVKNLADEFNVIKAFRVGSRFPVNALRPFSKSCIFLLDSAKRGEFGGTGETFDWSIAQRISESHMVMLAGGLTPENVGEAILTVRPYAVDVASGVESRPGIKDPGKLREFFAEVERANQALAASGLE